MIKGLRRQPWTCAKCLRRQRRHGSSIAAAPKAELPLATHSAPDASHDDSILRQVFDSESFWKEFSRRARDQASGRKAGLFRNSHLTKPEGFQNFAAASLQKAHKVVAKVLAANTVGELKNVARDMDRLSDLLCRVIDMADFVRSTHPDRKMQAAATQAHVTMYQYMNVLNTTTGLNDKLKKAVSTPEVVASWSEEEHIVAKILVKDFEKSAIDLPDDVRQRFVELSNEVSQTGQEFVDNMDPEKPYLSFPSSRLKGMDPQYVKRLTRWGTVTLPMGGMSATMALRGVEDPDVRREIYVATRTASKETIQLLEKMLKSRAELAKLCGYESYAHLALEDKMAKSPEAVNQFLQALAADNKGRVQEELQELLELKRQDARSGNFPGQLNAWDREFYSTRLISSLKSKVRSRDDFSAFFSLGTVMQGLSRLFSRLYGVRLVPRETPPGETWNDDVRRLDVIDETSGLIAVVYCDLFARPGKSPNPAHFTLRCSRRISEDEVSEASQHLGPFNSAVEATTDGMAHAYNPSDGSLYQLPTIALICDFSRTPPQISYHTSLTLTTPRPTLLSLREVQTLFHEMGHALHSIMGRTALQNVSGTRCATDFAELPSVLMEHFATAPEVLALFARHWETDLPLPYRLVQERLDIDRRQAGAETEAQILISMLDQAYHSALPLASEGWDSTRTYHDVWDRHSSVPEPAGTAWQGYFGHLFGYGATYYSYLFDRAIAGKVWKDVFQRRQGGALDRAAGERVRDEVLRWGGARDGWKCVAGVLGDERLAEGGEEAMKEVGRWGVKD